MIFDVPVYADLRDVSFTELLAMSNQAKLEGLDRTEIVEEVERRIAKKMRQLAIDALLKECI